MGNTFSYPYGIPWVSGDFGVIDGLGGSAGPVNMVNQSMKFYPSMHSAQFDSICFNEFQC